MLAYTTLRDLIYQPSIAEVAVYIGGLLAVLALPALIFGLTGSSKSEDKPKQ